VTDTLVTIEIGSDKIIVPKDVYEAKRQLERSERFNSAAERSERSERSEFGRGPEDRAPQGSRSEAETAEVACPAQPGRVFAAPICARVA
jgi:hypothetical protein